jgi:PAS domain S-box-containing protein
MSLVEKETGKRRLVVKERNQAPAYEDPRSKIEDLEARIRNLTRRNEMLRATVRRRRQAENRLLETDITERKQAEEALRHHLHFIRVLLDAIPNPIFYKDAGGVYLGCNKAFEDFIGKSRDGIIGKTVHDVGPKDPADAYHGAEEALFRQPGVQVYEDTVVNSDGMRHEVVFNKATFRNADGSLGGLVGTILDITERRRAEDRLRETTETLQAIIEASPLAIVVLDPAGRVTLWNPAAERMFGWSEDEVLGWRVPTVPEDLEEIFEELFKRAFAGERLSNLEGRGLRRDGSQVNILVSTAPLQDDKGTIYGNIGIFTDNTERKRAERALKESEERFRSLVEHSLVGFFIVQKGKVVFLNPEQEKLFGAVQVPFPLAELEASVYPEDMERFRECREALRAGRTAGRETEMRFYPRGAEPSERTLCWVHCRMAPVTYRGKDAVLVNMVDVTRVKALERIALIQEKMASLGQVATGIAHEIRNPLSGLNIYLSSLEKAIEESEGLEIEVREMTRSIFEMALSASRKIEGVIRRVMDFANPAPPTMVPVCVNHCVKETLQLSQVALRKVGIRITEVLAADLPRIQGDIRLLEQVLLNLLTNAAQALEGFQGEKRIEVASAREGDHVVVTVGDSGPGVPENLRERIFDPFFTTKREGTGIGLALSHRIVTEHGGFLEVDTSALGGAEFRLGIPVGNGPGSLSGPARSRIR